MTDQIVVDSFEPGIVSVLLNRAEKRNALSIELLEGFCHAMRDLETNSTNRIVILRGAGAVFSAGLDLHEAADDSLVERSAQAVHDALNALTGSSLISIAEVHGAALAGGAGLMAACDMVVAADTVEVGFPEVRRGLVPAIISGVLCRKVRASDLRELFLVAESIDAERARLIGLVQHVVGANELRDKVLEIARTVCLGGPTAVRETKKLLNDIHASSMSCSESELLRNHLKIRQSEEALEGFAAFAEKRRPQWK